MKLESYGVAPYIMIKGGYYILLNKTSKISYYNFFKGKINKNETTKECAIREFKEETGVLVDINDLEKYYFQKSPRKDVGIFLIDWTKYNHVSFDFQKKEIFSTSWVALKSIETSKNQQKIIDEIECDFKIRSKYLRNLNL